jgi:AcrR family transcriptional regulator
VSTKVATRLDREAVVRSAAELADRAGWSAVTLSQVAKDVDRHVTSLYAHVESVADLKREVGLLALDQLADAVGRAAMGRVRADGLQAIADVYRDYAIAHPGRVGAMVALRDGDPELTARGLRLAEPIWATFRSYGLAQDQVVLAHRVFSATVTGFVGRGGSDEDLRQAVALFDGALSAGVWPA